MCKASVTKWFAVVALALVGACARSSESAGEDAQGELQLSVTEQHLDNAGCRELATDLCLDGVRENCPNSSTSFKPCPSPGDIGFCNFKAAAVCARLAPVQGPVAN